MGAAMKQYIKTEEDFYSKEVESDIRREENIYAKYFPSGDEIKDFTSSEFVSIENFAKIYIDMIDVELDEELAWPISWPINI
jgi:hypothetical protein